MTDRVGQHIDDYRLLRLLGAGAFGEVYLGEHLYNQTEAAVKTLTPNQENLREFIKEASTTFRLKHPHIIPLLSFGISADDIPYLVMDYAPSGTLRLRHPKGTRLPVDTVVSYLLPLASALQYAHERRVIHRDVKPENVLIGRDGEILLSDFGVAITAPIERSLSTQNMQGTVPYMAPEQIRGKPQPASDQYALGVLAYEWLCGARPFQGTQWEILDQHQHHQPPSLRKKLPDLPVEVEEIILKALAKDPTERFASVEAFALALKATSSVNTSPSLSFIPLIAPPPILDSKSEAEIDIIEPPQTIHDQPPTKLSDRASAVVINTEFPSSEILAQPAFGPRRLDKRSFIATSIVAATFLVIGGLLFTMLHPFVAPATITITPDSKIEQDSYVIQAVTGNADPAKRQIPLRQLTFSPPNQSKLIPATGVGHIPAQAATGQLTFYNGSYQDFVIGSTTAIPGPNGVSVMPDSSVDVPASNPPTYGTITVNAHVTTAGASGNMAAGAIHETCCASGGFITVVSSAFTGGQDEQDYTFLQQSDVDGYTDQLTPTLSQQAFNGVKGLLKQNEQLAGDPECTTQSTQDQPVGDQGHNVASANVMVNATCTGLAYDASGAQVLAQNLLKRKAIGDLGQAYALAGTMMTKLTVMDVKDGVVTLHVTVSGTWSLTSSMTSRSKH